MAKYAEYIFNGTNYVQVSGSEGGSVTSRLVVTATGPSNNLKLSSTFTDILSAAQSGVDVVIKRANIIYYLESYDIYNVYFRSADSFSNIDDNDFEGISSNKIVVNELLAKVSGDTKIVPLVVTGQIVTDETPESGYYVDTDTTLSRLDSAINAKMPIEIRVIDSGRNNAISCFYLYGKDDNEGIFFRYSTNMSSDSKFNYTTTAYLTPFSDNEDGTLRCIMSSIIRKLPIIPAVTTTDSGKFLRVNSSGNWAAETLPNAEGSVF